MSNIFEDIKRQVSIGDVASYLGYEVNPRAGTRGRYLEMQLRDGQGGKLDTIIIKKETAGAKESYFHRGTGKGGSVVDFIKENLNNLGFHGQNEWTDVIEAASKFTLLPEDELHRDKQISQWKESTPLPFDMSRYDIRAVTDDMDAARLIYGPRLLTDTTIRTFSPWIKLISDKQSSYNHPCLGFPYRRPGEDNIVGFELRGFGTYKSKAPGTDSTHGAWIVDMNAYDNPKDVRRVYLAESAYDIMALWQHNRLQLKPDSSVFVSTGGQLTAHQITGLMDYYPMAKLVDCFDNDLVGRLYGIRVAAIISDVHLNITHIDGGISFEVNGGRVILPNDKVTTQEFSTMTSVSNRFSSMKPPKDFKDWNDVVMNVPMAPIEAPSKFQRDDRLEARRRNSINL